LIPFPKKKYKTIYCDPAWNERGAGKVKRGADKHYNLMMTDDIKKLPVQDIADDNCWLFMWVTNNFLKDGLEVMEHWGFKYVTNLAWGKDNDGLKNEFGLGYYFRGQHELCLFGVKGKLKPKVRNESTFILAKKTKHSKKPTRFYEKIERVSHSPMIELFARNTRDGWDSWGDELEY
jgi:N6-adenosine-specific RNA methylase IME4